MSQYVAFAAQAAISLRLATRHEKDGLLLAQLEAALDSRTVIDQALGIIMMQQRCTSAEAFDLLRRQSQNSHRKLREVATDLVTQTSGQPPASGKPFHRRLTPDELRWPALSSAARICDSLLPSAVVAD